MHFLLHDGLQGSRRGYFCKSRSFLASGVLAGLRFGVKSLRRNGLVGNNKKENVKHYLSNHNDINLIMNIYRPYL